VLVLRGRAGMGKTALLREMAERAASGECVAHRARACSDSRPAQELSDRLASSERLLHFAAAPNEKRPVPGSEPAWELRFWSPVTESNRRPSPYHRDPLKAPARHFAGRPGQTLYFSPVGSGSGQFAPDAASQIPPNR